MENLDPDVVNLSKAIRQTESGGNFKAKGKSGEYGAYQFTEPTWNAVAKKYGVNSTLNDATPEDQNKVVYSRIKEWKDKGFNPGQIASMWNAGEGEPDAYTGKFSNGVESTGTNKFGAKYDVPKYAKSVATAYQTLKNGGQVHQDPDNPSSVSQPKFPLTTGNETDSPATNTKNLTEGLIDAVPGAKTLGQSLGTNLGYGYEKLKGLVGGEDNSKYYDMSQPSIKDTAVAGLKTGATIASVLGAGKLLGGAMKGLRGLKALNNPKLEHFIAEDLSKFKGMSAIQKANVLKESLKGDVGVEGETLLKKALEELNPFVNKELGLSTFSERHPYIMKGLKTAGKYGLELAGIKTANELGLFK